MDLEERAAMRWNSTAPAPSMANDASTEYVNTETDHWLAVELARLPWWTVEQLVTKVGAPRFPNWHPDNCNHAVTAALPCTLPREHGGARHQAWDTTATLMAETPSPRKVERIAVVPVEPEAGT